LMINGMNVSSLVTKAPLGKQADQISQFLGVPLQASGAVPSISTVVHDVVEAAHENAAQNSAIIEPPLVVNQPPIASVIEPPIQPSAAPVTPVEPISPPENTNWQS
ncbi:MAG TPA: hypothetical protein VMR16_00955, partial [Candidatus Saccharimonadales bacterium]|nr:hypothetical protein [Candidatus Saccharimonadales bacterium]